MTNHSPSPERGIEPPDVDETDDALSALADGELTGAELQSLEELAVERGTTLDALTAPVHEVQTRIGALLHEPAPTANRTAHLAAALDALDEPEVVSLAAERVNKRKDIERHDRSVRLNRRLRTLSAVAAGFVVVAGFGMLALQGGGDDSESGAETAASPTTVASAMDAAGEDDVFMAESTDAMDEDAMEEEAMEDDAMEDSGDDGSAADAAPASADLGVEEIRVVEVDPGVDVAQLTFDDLDAVLASARSTERSFSVEDTQCVGIDRVSDVDPVVDVVVVVQSGREFEVAVLGSGELEIYELSSCDRID